MVSSREVPKMTSGQTELVKLMNRYLNGLLDPFATLLEVHKLMYFMQAAGQPLRLRFAKAPYGPFAENLRRVPHHHWPLLGRVGREKSRRSVARRTSGGDS